MSDSNAIQKLSFSFAVRIINLHKFLTSDTKTPYALANQILRSGTSIGANVTEAQAAQSKKDFIAKMAISAKEARETQYWLNLFEASELVSSEKLRSLSDENRQIIALLTSIIKTAQSRA
jgi:four helix bundle protein